MSQRTATFEVSLQRLPILRIEHPQANPLKLACTLRAGETLPSGLVITAEIHTSRNVAAETSPLASSSVTVGADATSFEVLFDSPQTNIPVTPESTRACWLVIYGVGDSDRLYTLATADLLLGWHAISRLTADPPATSILVEKGGVAWANGREYASGTMVTVGTAAYVCTGDHESAAGDQPGVGMEWESFWGLLSGGGGAQADWGATTGPAVILNKPTLGNSSSRNVGTGAGDVATGNHTHATSQITGLDTALAGKAASSHTHSISDVTGLQAAIDGKAASSHTHTTSQVTGLDTALAAKADLISGKLNPAQLPDLAISEDLGTAANQAAMLLLVGQRGDWCTRSDDGRIWIVRAEPSSVLGNWQAMSYPGSPVTSVAGRTGAVTLNAVDIANSTLLGRALMTAANPSAIRYIRINADNTVSLLDAAAFLTAIGAGSGGSKSLPPFLPINSQPPAANFATRDQTNTTSPIDVLDFDPVTPEYAVWAGLIPEGFNMTGGLKAEITWKLDTATPSGNVVWAAQIERMTTDLRSDSWDSAHTATGAANGTAGIATTTEITITNVDGVLAGEPFRIRIYRDAAAGGDTAAFDAELILLEVRGN